MERPEFPYTPTCPPVSPTLLKREMGLGELYLFYLYVFPKFHTLDTCYLVKSIRLLKNNNHENFIAMFNSKLLVKINLY